MALLVWYTIRKLGCAIYRDFLSVVKIENFVGNFFDISAQNIDCWYTLEPPRRGGSN